MRPKIDLPRLSPKLNKLLFFKSPNPQHFQEWCHSRPWSHFLSGFFYCDISDCHIHPVCENTCAQCVHLTNPCTKQKVLSQTKPKGKIYKMKSLCNYITQKLGSRAVFQHDNDPKHTSKTTIALLKWLRVKVMDWPSMSPDLNPIEYLWGILKWKVEVCKVSNICQLHDVVMEEWKSIPVATCEALVNSMPKIVKAILDNDSGHTKYWQLTWCMLILTTLPKGVYSLLLVGV